VILVVGATGFVGGEVCRRLAERGERVRALVRPTSAAGRVARLRQLGVETVEGDLKDRASLDAACRGATTVITTASTTVSRQPDDSLADVDERGQMQLVDAARGAGARHVIYVSFSGTMERDSPLRDAKRAVERHLRESGLTYTILRPSVFMEVWLSPMLGFDYANATARIYGSGEQPISWISLGDVAAFVVACVGNPAAENAVLELGGPEALSPLEVVRVFEEATGRRFAVEHVPREALEAQYREARDPMQKSFAALMCSLGDGDVIDMGRTLERFPLRLTSVREYAARAVGGARAG
jgi:uncharacterized protein YbjT (DUF2867 family)